MANRRHDTAVLMLAHDRQGVGVGCEVVLFLHNEARVSLPDLVTDVMRRKLLRRAQRQKTQLSLKDLEEIERRAGSAYRELKEASFRLRHPQPRWRGQRQLGGVLSPVGRCAPSAPCGGCTPARRTPVGASTGRRICCL